MQSCRRSATEHMWRARRNKKEKTISDSQGGTSWITRRLEWTLKQDTNPLN